MIALGANAPCLEQRLSVTAPARQEEGLNNWNYQSGAIRKPAQSEGRNRYDIAAANTNSNWARAALDDQISALMRDYGFPAKEVVTDFLVTHRGVRAVLRDAVPQLRATFGANNIFNLEVSRDEDGSETMYAVAIWQADVRRASEALNNFLENWWLQRMNAATSDLAFVYKLV